MFAEFKGKKVPYILAPSDIDQSYVATTTPEHFPKPAFGGPNELFAPTSFLTPAERKQLAGRPQVALEIGIRRMACQPTGQKEK